MDVETAGDTRDFADRIADNINAGDSGLSKNIGVLALSIFLFFSLGLVLNPARDLLIIIAVLLIHEAGHFAGMKLFRFKNVSMFFIPFLGAAVKGESVNVKGYKRAIVLLLGPVPGLVLGMVLLVYGMKTGQDLLKQVGNTLLFINGFNLLPFHPLDGGRLLNILVFSRNIYLELVFTLLTSLALLGIGISSRDPFLSIFGILILLSVRFSYKAAKISRQIKETYHPDNADAGVDGALVRSVAAVLEIDEPSEPQIRDITNYTKVVWEKINFVPVKILPTILILMFYLGTLASTAVMALALNMAAGRSERLVDYYDANGNWVFKHQIFHKERLVFETTLDEDSLYHGKSVDYHPDGKTVKKTGYWKRGKWDGEWVDYDMEGNITEITTFDSGAFVRMIKIATGDTIRNIQALPAWQRRALIKHLDDAPQRGRDRKLK